MNLLDKLWKPATDIKPEELIGKICRYNGPLSMYKWIPVIIIKHCGSGLIEISDGEFIARVEPNLIQYLDDSDEAVKEAIKDVFESAYSIGWNDKSEEEQGGSVDGFEASFDQWLKETSNH